MLADRLATDVPAQPRVRRLSPGATHPSPSLWQRCQHDDSPKHYTSVRPIVVLLLSQLLAFAPPLSALAWSWRQQLPAPGLLPLIAGNSARPGCVVPVADAP